MNTEGYRVTLRKVFRTEWKIVWYFTVFRLGTIVPGTQNHIIFVKGEQQYFTQKFSCRRRGHDSGAEHPKLR